MEFIKHFFSQISETTLWQRIFNWKKIKVLIGQAREQLLHLENEIEEIRQTHSKLEARYNQVEFERNQLDKQVYIRNAKIESLETQLTEFRERISRYESEKDHRLKEHDTRIAMLDQARNSYENKEKEHEAEKLQQIEEYHEEMKKKWSVHENDVQEMMRLLCVRHEIFYEEEVPFRGKPDNTIEVCDEYIIFDAKCPKTDDLSNFPLYIKSEAEKAIKYLKQDGVRNEIFLVVPTNTIEHLPKTSFDMADYKVYVITKDALEPVLIALKKRENYEYLEQLSPEERENICRVIGKFFHSTKRKVQVDLYFINDMLELLGKSNNELPENILKEVHRFEKAEKLNPPLEKRSKEIPIKKLEDDHQKAKNDAMIRNVI